MRSAIRQAAAAFGLVYRRSFSLHAVVVLLMAGCAGIATSAHPPRIQLAHIDIKDASALETVLQVRLRVFNTGAAPLVISGVACDLEIDGKKCATGVSGQRVEIGPYDTGIVSVDLYSSILDVVFTMIGWARAGEQGKGGLPHAVSGHLQIGDNRLLPKTPFRTEGVLNLENLTFSGK